MRLSPLTGTTLCTVAVVVIAFVLFADVIPPRSNTYGAMHMMKRRILQYAATHDTLPESLNQLPTIEGYYNSITDGWGRPILWHIEGEQVTLTSFGRDGRPGGFGEDADMVGVFRVKTSDGRWSEELCPWQIDPFASVR